MNSENFKYLFIFYYLMEEENILLLIKENISLARKGKYRKREIFSKALKFFSIKQILSLVGVRRCGKSTIMKELVRIALEKTSEKNIFYLNLEHPFFNQYKGDVNNLNKIYEIFKKNSNKGKKIYVFLDEIQFFSDWQVFVKHLYERDEAKIILTGSNSRLLSSELATLLSGRTIPLHVYPFSFNEAKVSFEDYLFNGGFPEIVLSKESKNILAETYYKNILYQDVIPRFGIKNSLAIENLSYYLISNVGKEISFNTLKSISKLDDKTIKQYMLYLQDANLIYILNSFDFSLKKMIGNKKKIYCVDPIFTQLSFKSSPDYGKLFENLIYMDLRRNDNDIYFQRNGSECDFIIKKGLKISYALQVCYDLDKNNQEREIKGLMTAIEKFGLKEGYIVTKDKNIIKKIDEKTVNIIDYRNFLKKFGMNSEN